MTTDQRVGAQLETVPQRRVTNWSDRMFILSLLIISAAIHVITIANASMTARDSLGLGRDALQLQKPSVCAPIDTETGKPKTDWTIVDVMQTKQHPPGYPLAVLAMYQIVRSLDDAPIQDEILLATQVTSAIAAFLLVLPTYWLGRMMFGQFAGFAAALIFQMLPVALEVTSDGLTDGLYLFGFGSAMMLGMRALRKPGIGGFLTTGLAIGCTYLVRPEGLVVALALTITVLGFVVARYWPFSLSVARITALAVGTALPAIPYMVLIGGITNKPTGNNLIPIHDTSPREAVTQYLNVHVQGPFFAAWYTTEDGNKPTWVASALFQETFKTFHYATMILALLGLVVAAQRLRVDPWLCFPMIVGGLVLAILIALPWVRGYISERHTLPLVYIGVLFAAGGLQALPKLLAPIPPWGKHFNIPATSIGVLLLIVASCVPMLFKSLHDNRLGHKYAGLYLAEHMNPEDAIVDPFEWARFYSGRSVYTVPDNPETTRITYAILESSKKDNPHSRLIQIDLAHNIQADGRSVVVYHWPENAPVEDAKVLVYKLDQQAKPLR